MSTTAERLAAALASRYTIERELGQGGMATVYLAEDLKHHRKVAIKVLREDIAASLGAARFLREIEIAAQLQHPHILPLLDSGEAEGFLYYVMPYVTGQSLRERIGREGELPVHEAVRLISEVVDALAHAHEHGVVHRDIKPDNVMLSGRHALVADFGVAKAVSEATGRNAITTLGVAIGTPTYMSPEQAAADPHIDHRSDIYAVGVMAYELLAGRPPFVGATPQQVLASHVTEAPDPVSKRRPGIAPALEQAVMKCLAKRPADRWQTAAQLLSQLEVLATPSGGVTPTQTRPVTAFRTAMPPRAMLLTAGGLVVALGLLGLFLLLSPSHVAVVLGQATQVTSDAGLEILPTMSPDGKLVAYAAGTSARMRIFVRPVAGGRTIPLTDDTTAIQSQPRWSPDGGTILYLAGGGVFTAPALGGPARPLIPATAGAPIRTAAWSPDGREIAFARRDSLLAFGVSGASTRPIARMLDLHSCSWSPNGKVIACVSGNADFVALGPYFGNTAASVVVIIPAGGGAARAVTDSTQTNQSPAWSPDGRLLYFVSDRQGPRDIFALPVSSAGRANGVAVRVTTGLNAMSVAVSPDGKRLAYAVYTAQANIWGVPVPTSSGSVSVATATAVTSGTQVIEGIRVSPDRKWLTYDSNLHGNSDLYRIAIGGGEPERLTTDTAGEYQPVLSPDGSEVAFHSIRGGVRQIMVMTLNGAPPVQVAPSPAEQRVADWAPDGRALTWYDRNLQKVWMVRRNAAGKWQQPVLRGDSLRYPRWSPDGRTIVANSREGGIVEVGSDSGAPRTIYAPRPDTPDPAAEMPAWSPDGKSIWFKSHDAGGKAAIWSIPPTGGAPRLLVSFDDPTRPSYRTEWASDGKRIFFAINDRQSDIWVVEIARK